MLPTCALIQYFSHLLKLFTGLRLGIQGNCLVKDGVKIALGPIRVQYQGISFIVFQGECSSLTSGKLSVDSWKLDPDTM